MADINSENKAAVSVPPVTEFDPTNIPTGFSANSPQALAAISDLQKSRGSLRSVAQNVVAGGAAGAKAAQGSTDPLAAFMQGTAAGLQIPAMLYKQKQDQLKDTLDASPLAATMPDLADRYPVLASMPTAMAIKTIQDIAVDAEHLKAEDAAKQAQIQKTANVETVLTPKEVEAYKQAMPGINVEGMRKADVIELAKLKGVAVGAAGEAAAKEQDQMMQIKKAFDTQPAVAAWSAIKDDAKTLSGLKSKVEQNVSLTPPEQVMFANSFKNLMMKTARPGEQTFELLENKDVVAQLKELAINPGAKIKISPEDAREMLAAANAKVNEVYQPYLAERQRFADSPLIKGQTAREKFIVGDQPEKMEATRKYYLNKKTNVGYWGVRNADGSVTEVE